MNGDGLVAEIVGFNPPYHIANALRNPAVTPRCDCGLPATQIARFNVFNGEGHELATGLLLCDACAELLRQEGNVVLNPIEALARAVSDRETEYYARKVKKRKLPIDNGANS